MQHTPPWASRARRSAQAAAGLALLSLLLACGKPAGIGGAAGDASPSTIAANTQATQGLALDQRQGFDDAQRGFIAKPTGGERPIALTAGLYRLFFKIRKPVVARWEEAKAGFWDSAVKGSEALRTAIARAVKNEVCVELGKPAVQI